MSDVAEESGELSVSAAESGATRLTSSGPPPTPAQIPASELMAMMSDRYRILRRIGHGGMGEVFLAEHATIGKPVAIKILSEDFARKPRIVQRFLQEARAASLIEHENVVDITDFGHTPSGLPFMTMEYLCGEDLKAMLRREGRLPWPRARAILLQVLAALEAAHAKGVIHRDIKPDNCFRITRGDNHDFIKVLDFGIAKVLGEELDQGLTQTGVVMGSAEYMSPEQAKSEPLDARTDLYSVGVILFQMLTGRVPFRANGFMGTVSKQILEPPPSARQTAPDANIDRALDQLVRKSMAKAPDERFQSAAQFAAALRALPPGAHALAGPRRRTLLLGLGVALGLAGALAWSLGPGDLLQRNRPGPGDAPAAAGLVAVAPTPSPTRQEPVAAVAEPAPTPAPEPEPEPPPVVVPEPPQPAEPARKAREARPRKQLPVELSGEQLRAGFAVVEPVVKDCRKHGLPGTTVHVQVTIGPDGAVEGASTRKPYQGTPLARCVEAAVKMARFPATQTRQRSEPGFKL